METNEKNPSVRFVIPAHNCFGGDGTRQLWQLEVNGYQGTWIESYRCAEGEAALTNIHSVPCYLLCACSSQSHGDNDWTAKISTPFLQDHSISGLQCAINQFRAQGLLQEEASANV